MHFDYDGTSCELSFVRTKIQSKNLDNNTTLVNRLAITSLSSCWPGECMISVA